jgi:hypothetical protein
MTRRSLRLTIPLACAAALSVGSWPGTAKAQAGFSQTVRNTISVSVPGVAGVSAMTAPRIVRRMTGRLELTAVVTVKANAPYRVHVYASLPELGREGVRVSVRDAQGVFLPLQESRAVTVVEYGQPGTRRVEVTYRIEGNDALLPQAPAVVMRYEALVERGPSEIATIAAGGGA